MDNGGHGALKEADETHLGRLEHSFCRRGEENSLRKQGGARVWRAGVQADFLPLKPFHLDSEVMTVIMYVCSPLQLLSIFININSFPLYKRLTKSAGHHHNQFYNEED